MLSRKIEYVFILICSLLLLFSGCMRNKNGNDVAIRGGLTISGLVVDRNNAPLSGATVSINGIDSDQLTDGSGRFGISIPQNEINGKLLVIAGKKGYAPFYNESVSVVQDGSEYIIPSAITLDNLSESVIEQLRFLLDGSEMKYDIKNMELLIAEALKYINPEGIIEILGDFQNLIHPRNMLILIDASGSTNEIPEEGTPQTIFDIEIEAAKHFVQLYASYKIGIIRFAKDAELVQEPTRNKNTLIALLDEMKADGAEQHNTSDAGTDYSKALQLALTKLTTDNLCEGARKKFVMLLSDGIPTLPIGSGITQELDDRLIPLQIANAMQENKIVAYTYGIGIPEDVAHLTTLPSIAAITGGMYCSITQPVNFMESLGEENLLGIENIKIILNDIVQSVIIPQADGAFSFKLDIPPGKHQLKVAVNRFNNSDLSESADFNIVAK